MAQLTSLSAFGISGVVHVFTAKTTAPIGGPHNPGRITELGVGGWPSQRHAFVAKTAEPIGGPHNPGRIVALSVAGLSGRTRIFIRKQPAIPPATPKTANDYLPHECSGGFNFYHR